MKAASCILLVVVSVAINGASGCKAKSSAFPLSLATLQQTHSGQIAFEERGGQIFVTVTDEFGDSHIHLLDYRGVSNVKALEILKAKQAELRKMGVEREKPSNGGSLFLSETNRTSPEAASRR